MEKNTAKTHETITTKNEKDLEKTHSSKIKKKESKKKYSETKNISPNTNTENENEFEKTSKNRDQVLKRKVTEDGVSIERVLSAGEVSSGFETVSSIDSQVDFKEINLISEDDLTVAVEVENDLAFKNKREKKERLCYWKTKSKSPVRYNQYAINEYGNRRPDSFRNFNKNQYRQKSTEDINYMYRFDRRDRESSELDDNCFRRYLAHDLNWIKNFNFHRSARASRRDDNIRSRCSRSNKRINRFRVSRSSERNIQLNSPSYEGRKFEPRRSRSIDRNSTQSDTKRDSPFRTSRKTLLPKSPECSVWNRLGNRTVFDRIKNQSNIKSVKTYSHKTTVINKERTPFLVQLERKPKGTEHLKSSKKKKRIFDEKGKTEVLENVNSTISDSEFPSAMNQNSSSSSPHSTQSNVYPAQSRHMPSFSMENLPLVPGPTGLPVHITMTGEQIPHDIDGRRIPVGPNGFYLPLDPTGRLFPHIISPGNQAVPIHMTKDGVLRLPNSEPVPYGPGHQLPVNIDGKVIPIGPDSKPLYPCFGLPKQPPLEFLQTKQPSEAPQQTAQTDPYVKQMENEDTSQILSQAPLLKNQQSIEMDSQTFQKENSPTANLLAEKFDCSYQSDFSPSNTDLSLSDFIHDSFETVSKADLLEKYKKKAQEKNEDVLKCLEIEKNLGINPSKGGVKRSIPMKLSQKKPSKEDACSSGSDMILDSNDSDYAPNERFKVERSKGSLDEMFLSSDDEQNILKMSCDNEISKIDINSKPDDPISRKIQETIKSLNQKNYKPPALGRFIISDLIIDLPVKKFSNDSPLLRNRIKLPFLTPNFSDVPMSNMPGTEEKARVNFKFLPQTKSLEKTKKRNFKCKRVYNSANAPVFTFDFSMQCDFTSAVIKNLELKVSDLETEVVRLKNVNANLLDTYRNVQGLLEKKDDELKMAFLEIQDKHYELQSLKRFLETRWK